MDSSYHNDLRIIKESFRGTSETPILIQLIASGTQTKTTTILDVGVGSGEQMYKVAAALAKLGIEARVTGVDLHIPDAVSQAGQCPINFIRKDFMSMDLPLQFDVVNATQSLYYFADPEKTLRKMLEYVTPGGRLFVTIWTRNCLLYDVFQRFFNPTGAVVVTNELVISMLQHFVHPSDVEVHCFDGEIDLDLILQNDVNLKAFLHILSRKGKASECGIETLGSVREYLAGLGEIGNRKNAIISIRR